MRAPMERCPIYFFFARPDERAALPAGAFLPAAFLAEARFAPPFDALLALAPPFLAAVFDAFLAAGFADCLDFFAAVFGAVF